MPPKTNNKIQIFEIEKFSIAHLPELQGKKEEIKTIIDANPVVEIVDNETYEQAKKSRTAVRTLRTGIEKEQKDVKKKIKDTILDAVDTEYDTLVSGIKIEETLRQDAVTAYEEKKELERQEKARLEKLRIDNIKSELDNYAAEWKDAFNLMTFDTIENIGANFYESYTTFDTTILQEFETLFPTKIEELTKLLEEKTALLTYAENARLEKIRIAEEAQKLAEEKAEFEANKKLADEAEAKAKAEREAFEKEKAEFEAKKKANEAIANAVYDLPKTIPTVSPEMQYGIDMEEKGLELLQTIDSSVPENTTANVCTSLEEEKVDCIASRLVPIVDEMNIAELKEMQSTTTWESIFEEFTTSGGKSFSKWLKDNYNPPTKIQ